MKKRTIKSYVGLCVFGVLLDRVTKAWALSTLSKAPIQVAPGIRFTLSWNRGVSWSMLTPDTSIQHLILSVVIVAITLSFLVYAMLEHRRGRSVLFHTLVVAGAASNLIDRFLYGAVIDFILLSVGNWHWPVFNVADILVVAGISGIVWKNWREETNGNARRSS